MSCDEANVSDANLEKLDELTNKLNRCNKNIKLVLELLQKLHEATEKKTQSSYIAPNSAEYKNKRQAYLTKLNNKEIKCQRKEKKTVNITLKNIVSPNQFQHIV